MGEWKMSGNGEHNCPVYFDDNGDEWWIGELEPTDGGQERALLAESGPDAALEALIRERAELLALVNDLAKKPRRHSTDHQGWTVSITLGSEMTDRLDAAATGETE